MSSIESMISDVEEDYFCILNFFEKYVNLKDGYFRFNSISENDLLKLLRRVMNFHRKIEYFITSTKRLAKKEKITQRLEGIMGI